MHLTSGANLTLPKLDQQMDKLINDADPLARDEIVTSYKWLHAYVKDQIL